MNIRIRKDGYLVCNKLKIRCTFGKAGIQSQKKEGDKTTPKGKFFVGKLYYRPDRIKNVKTFLKKKIIKKNTRWCNDINSKFYNREINFNSTIKAEKLFRKDYKYNLLAVINYNIHPTIRGKGSAIFLHLTKNFKPTAGCVAIKINDFLKILKVIKQNTKILIG